MFRTSGAVSTAPAATFMHHFRHIHTQRTAWTWGWFPSVHWSMCDRAYTLCRSVCLDPQGRNVMREWENMCVCCLCEFVWVYVCVYVCMFLWVFLSSIELMLFTYQNISIYLHVSVCAWFFLCFCVFACVHLQIYSACVSIFDRCVNTILCVSSPVTRSRNRNKCVVYACIGCVLSPV